MGKLKRSTLVKKAQNKSQKSIKQSKLSIEELLEHAEECIDEYELEKAYQLVKRALDIDPKHIQALETMASVQMEMGNSESSKNIYQKLVELSPNEGFSKYMCLAQLSSGQEAVDFYKKGIELILIEYEKQEKEQKPKSSKSVDNEDENTGKISKQDISTAYSSLAELYLTDLCMEENADVSCKSFLEKSLEYDAKNPESLQLFASYWLSKNENEQAKKFILESLDLWLPKYIEANENGVMIDPTEAISLTYDSRINTTRILTEVEEFDKAITVLEQLIDEDDEVVVIWYMLGWVNYCKGEDYYSNAKFYLKKAEEIGAKIKYQQRYLDDELRAHIKELLEKLANVASDDEAEEDGAIGGDKANKGNNGDVNDDNDEEYESTSNEEDVVESVSKTETRLKKEKSNTLAKKTSKDRNNNNGTEEPMELT